MKTLIYALLICCQCHVVFPQDIQLLKEFDQDTAQTQYDLDYYEASLKKAMIMRNTGIGLTIGGLGLAGVGMMTAMASNTWEGIGIGGFIFIAGGAVMIIGLPPWIAGSIKVRKNREAIDNIERRLSFSLGPNSYGIGLRVRF
jgi:hypothetical protein